jgi:uncharacterized protein (DUF4415 family)
VVAYGAQKLRKGAVSMAEGKFREERGYAKADWDEVSDNPEITTEEFAQAKPFAEVFPELAAAMRRGLGKQRAPTKDLVSLRLSQEVLTKFRAQGPGWQARIDEALKKAVQDM